MDSSGTLIWFRNDLRLSDNPALSHALSKNAFIIPVFIYTSEEQGNWSDGAASRWWLHHSLSSLSESLEKLGLQLIIEKGKAAKILTSLAITFKAENVFFNKQYEPWAIHQENNVISELLKHNIKAQSFPGNLLIDPENLLTKNRTPFKVFTPFWNELNSKPDFTHPLPAPTKKQISAIKAQKVYKNTSQNLSIADLDLLPKIKWDEGIKKSWTPGEHGAEITLKTFIDKGLHNYEKERDKPYLKGVSRLSPHLHFGEISPRVIWHIIKDYASANRPVLSSANCYLRELGWREFSHYLLYHFPNTTENPLRPEFKKFPWKQSKKFLQAWQQGKTGYPIVDAGMKELWHTGWMHNRVRMVAASFLVKDLLIDWQDGARWFWETLVDADLANNTLGWQWVAGCGADAAPYFRIFNPILQGEKFDPGGVYVKEWLPELKDLPPKWIHKPWLAPAKILTEAGIKIGDQYPKPIVNHNSARLEALDAFTSIKSNQTKLDL